MVRGRYRSRTFSVSKRVGPGRARVSVRTRKTKLPKVKVSYEVPS